MRRTRKTRRTRKKASARVRSPGAADSEDARARYESFVQAIDGILWEADPKTSGFTYVSPQAERILGYPSSEWLGPDFWPAHIHPEDRAEAVGFCLRETQAGRSHTFEYRMIAKDGRAVWLRDVCNVVLEKGVPVKLRGILFDISPHREIEGQMKGTLSLLRSTLDATADGLLVVGQDGKAVSFNRRFAEMWRIPPEILETRDDDRMIAFVLDQLKDPEGFVARVRSLYATPLEESIDVLEFKDGRVFERYSFPQYLDGVPTGRVWSFRDVTKSRAYAESLAEKIEELRRANEKLRELDRLKRDFLAAVSHELRTPLAAIQGSLDNFAAGLAGPLTQRQERVLEIASRNSARLDRLVGNLLDLASLETGRFTLARKRVDLAETVRLAVESLRPLAERKGRRLVEDLPTGPLPAEVDPDRIVQILGNLVGNAVRFSLQEIRVGLSPSNGLALLIVEDDGPGVPEEDLPRLFERFTRLDVQGAKSQLGLGLSIVAALAEAHGGSARAERRDTEGGTRFVVAIPTEKS